VSHSRGGKTATLLKNKILFLSNSFSSIWIQMHVEMAVFPPLVHTSLSLGSSYLTAACPPLSFSPRASSEFKKSRSTFYLFIPALQIIPKKNQKNVPQVPPFFILRPGPASPTPHPPLTGRLHPTLMLHRDRGDPPIPRELKPS
jgi:hypothetical protein